MWGWRGWGRGRGWLTPQEEHPQLEQEPVQEQVEQVQGAMLAGLGRVSLERKMLVARVR